MVRNIEPEHRERRKQFLALLQDAGINAFEGVQALFKEKVGIGLGERAGIELNMELGYSKYDYRNM